MPAEDNLKVGVRHLLGLNDGQKGRFSAGRIRIHATEEVASGHNGQMIIWWLANLLARQFHVVRHVEFDLPAVPMRDGVALFGHRPGLRETVLATVALIAAEEVTASGPTDEVADIVLRVGPKITPVTDRDFAIWGEGWCCAAASFLDVPAGASHFPVGPMLAATLGAAEAFQRITDWHGEGRLPRDPLFLSAWTGKTAAEWSALQDGPPITALKIEPFYLCGAGAVGQAVVATLSYFSGRSGHAVILDGDPLDGSNLNRYCLSHRESPAGKAEACKGVLATSSFTVDAMPHFWKDYQALPLPRTKSAVLNADEAAYKYRLIVSCVDKNDARRELQNAWPLVILGGSTYGLSAKVSTYDCSTGECLKCANPPTVYPTVEEEARTLRKMDPEEREAVLGTLGEAKAAAIRAYLTDPGCGQVAAKYINELGEMRRREFSVGFVSVASGIFLAVALVQKALGAGELAQGSANFFSFSFLSRKPGHDFFSRAEGCECSGTGGALFRQLWTKS